MNPLPRDVAMFRQAAAALVECYRDPMIRACQKALVILASKHGSASVHEAGKAIRILAAVKPRVFPAVPGPLIELGLIRPLAPTEPVGATGGVPLETRYEVIDHDGAFAWLVHGFRPPATPSCGPSARPAVR
jgi:hypothetical protein